MFKIKYRCIIFVFQVKPNVKSIIFYKNVSISVTEKDNIQNINIVTLNNTAEQSLYQILRQIYSPLLALGNSLYSSKLLKNLNDLESNLRVFEVQDISPI
ncbi:unnamed protein product [Leptidea sinapis]|uniref:Uncharacterized protein n=1 Tax=Leptidea sinapis TaxID=189913 RepID=A0A5E4QD12_9NEOP|nr:unnamed protein product [Leptidea sinapis]